MHVQINLQENFVKPEDDPTVPFTPTKNNVRVIENADRKVKGIKEKREVRVFEVILVNFTRHLRITTTFSVQTKRSYRLCRRSSVFHSVGCSGQVFSTVAVDCPTDFIDLFNVTFLLINYNMYFFVFTFLIKCSINNNKGLSLKVFELKFNRNILLFQLLVRTFKSFLHELFKMGSFLRLIYVLLMLHTYNKGSCDTTQVLKRLFLTF